MRELNLTLQRLDDVEQAINIHQTRVHIYQDKLDSYARRKEFRKDNVCFELYRNKFYRGLECEIPTEHVVDKNDVKAYWETMWNKSSADSKDYSGYLYEFIPPETSENVFPSYQEFLDMVKELPSWKAVGCDGIYNFFIKKCSSLHEHIYNIIKKTCIGEINGEGWFYRGITYSIPKGTSTKGSDYRPIICMSNLYKLTTKCVTKVIQELVEYKSLLSENQLGTVRKVQGAK